MTGIALHLRGEVRKLFFDWLAKNRPDLVPRYRELYRKRRVRARTASAAGWHDSSKAPISAPPNADAGRFGRSRSRPAARASPGRRRLFEVSEPVKPSGRRRW